MFNLRSNHPVIDFASETRYTSSFKYFEICYHLVVYMGEIDRCEILFVLISIFLRIFIECHFPMLHLFWKFEILEKYRSGGSIRYSYFF